MQQMLCPLLGGRRRRHRWLVHSCRSPIVCSGAVRVHTLSIAILFPTTRVLAINFSVASAHGDFTFTEATKIGRRSLWIRFIERRIDDPFSSSRPIRSAKSNLVQLSAECWGLSLVLGDRAIYYPFLLRKTAGRHSEGQSQSPSSGSFVWSRWTTSPHSHVVSHHRSSISLEVCL